MHQMHRLHGISWELHSVENGITREAPPKLTQPNPTQPHHTTPEGRGSRVPTRRSEEIPGISRAFANSPPSRPVPIKAGHPPTTNPSSSNNISQQPPSRILCLATPSSSSSSSSSSPAPVVAGRGQTANERSHGGEQQGGDPGVRRGGGAGAPGEGGTAACRDGFGCAAAAAAAAAAAGGDGGGAAQGVGAGAADDGAGAGAAAGRDLLPRRPAAPVQEPVARPEAGAGAAVLLPHLPLGLQLQPPPPPLRRHRRPHHCQPRHPPGNQLRQARQPASNHRPILELRAAADLRAAGELAGPGGGAGVHRVAGDGVHAPGGGGAGAAAHRVPAAGLHRHLLRRPLPGVAGVPPPGLHRRLPLQGHAHRVHGRRRRHRLPAAAQGPTRHRPLHHPHGLRRRHDLRRPPAPGVGVADHRHGRRLPRHPPRHTPNQRSESEAFLGVGGGSPDVGDRLHHHLLLLQRPRHQHHRQAPQGSEPSIHEHARLQRLLRRAGRQDRDHDRHPVPHRGDRGGSDVRVDQQLPGGREQGDDGDRGDEHGGVLRLLLRHHGLLLPLRRQLQRRVPDGGVQHRDGGGGAGDAALPDAALPLHPQRDPVRHHHHRRCRAHRRPRRRQAVEGGQAGLLRVRGRLPRRAPGVGAGRPGGGRGDLAVQDPAAGDPAQHRRHGAGPRHAELPQHGAVPRGRARAAVPRRRRRVGHLLRQLDVPAGEDHAVSPRGGGARRQGQPLLRPLHRPRHERGDGDRHERAGRAGGAEEGAGQAGHRPGAGEPGGVGDGEDVQLGGRGDVRVGPHLLQRRRGRHGGAVQGAALTLDCHRPELAQVSSSSRVQCIEEEEEE